MYAKEDKFILLFIHVDNSFIVSTDKIFNWFTTELLRYVRSTTVFHPELGVTQKYNYIEINRAYGDTNSYIKFEVPMAATINFKDAKSNDDNESLLPVIGSLRFICNHTRLDLLVTTEELSTSALPSDLYYFIADRVEYF
jgi:hypothetical protein